MYALYQFLSNDSSRFELLSNFPTFEKWIPYFLIETTITCWRLSRLVDVTSCTRDETVPHVDHPTHTNMNLDESTKNICSKPPHFNTTASPTHKNQTNRHLDRYSCDSVIGDLDKTIVQLCSDQLVCIHSDSACHCELVVSQAKCHITVNWALFGCERNSQQRDANDIEKLNCT